MTKVLQPYTADTPLQTPVSFVGGTRLAWGIFTPGSRRGWRRAARVTLACLAVLLAWSVTIVWYTVLTAFTVLGWGPWAIYTLNRRHHIHDARRLAQLQRARLASLAHQTPKARPLIRELAGPSLLRDSRADLRKRASPYVYVSCTGGGRDAQGRGAGGCRR